MMAGPFFLMLFALVVLPPVFLIAKLRLTGDEKIAYQIFSVIIPVGMFFLSKLTISAGLINSNLSTQTGLEKAMMWLMIASFVFGSWIVYLIGALRQNKSDSSSEE